MKNLITNYKSLLDSGKCWCQAGKVCPLGKNFLENLYSWSENTPLNPMLAWKICEPCEKNPQIDQEAKSIVKEMTVAKNVDEFFKAFKKFSDF